MKSFSGINRRAGLIVALVASCDAAFAGERTNDYSGIPLRNIFSLRAALVQTNPAPTAAASPPQQLKLTGIAALLPRKWAVLQIQEPGKPARSVLLKEGTKESGVEVVEIDAQARWVKILNGGAPMTLTFANNGLRSNSPQLAGGPDPNHVPVPLLPPPGAGDP